VKQAGHASHQSRLNEDEIRSIIRQVPDFPKPGINFIDITTLLAHPQAFRLVVDEMTEVVRAMQPDVIAAIESRGFILAAPIALSLGVGFVPVRKVGKLPAETIRAEYDLEYGTSTVEMHKDAISPGQTVVVVDDLLATGGTAAATVQMAEQLGGRVAGVVCMVELTFLEGRSKLEGYRVETLVRY